MMMRFLKIAMTIRVARKCQKFTNHLRFSAIAKFTAFVPTFAIKLFPNLKKSFQAPGFAFEKWIFPL